MMELWKWLQNPENRHPLVFLGALCAAIVSGAWAYYVFVVSQPSALEQLSKLGIQVNTESVLQQYPNGSHELVLLLGKAGVDIDRAKVNGPYLFGPSNDMPIIFNAIEEENWKWVKTLISAGARLDLRYRCYSPLAWAVELDNKISNLLPHVGLLYSNEAMHSECPKKESYEDFYDHNALGISLASSQYDIADRIIELGVNFDSIESAFEESVDKITCTNLRDLIEDNAVSTFTLLSKEIRKSEKSSEPICTEVYKETVDGDYSGDAVPKIVKKTKETMLFQELISKEAGIEFMLAFEEVFNKHLDQITKVCGMRGKELESYSDFEQFCNR